MKTFLIVNTLLYQAIHQFAGPRDHGTTAPGNESRPGDLPANVVVSLNTSNRTKSALARQGYTCARCFAVLPSLTSPRWLFPLENGRSALVGLEIYKPYARTGRILKGLLTTMVTARCQGLALHRVLVASRATLPLEDFVREVTGECQPEFALSLSTEKRFQKLTVQAMRPDGEILGYIKLPLTQAAVDRIRHEAETLKRLWSFAPLRTHIPQVLYSGEWGHSHILFQSAGPPQPGPTQLNSQSYEFLQLLWGIGAAQKPGHVLWEEVAARWCKADPSLESSWQALGQAALERAKRELHDVMIPCGVSHGDFAPWNTRVGDHGLYVFDWESASWETPTLWDVFHFKTQAGALLDKRNDLHISRDPRSGERASFVLYLLSSACQLFGEESPTQVVGLECRRQLLAKQLGGY